jgi:type-F conjugative transfer system pilin assembly protein TrbC
MTFSGSGGMIYLFISKSVPLPTLRNYAADMERVGSSNIRMVMRGFVGGMRSFRQTSRFVREILIKEPDCEPSPEKRCEAYSAEVTIDPVLFSRYGIDRVPAVAYVDEPQATDGRFNAMSDFHVLFGDVSLSYALETINEKAKNGKLAKIIENLRSGFFEEEKNGDGKS